MMHEKNTFYAIIIYYYYDTILLVLQALQYHLIINKSHSHYMDG